jgi:argininosuccinate lyase
VGRIVKDCLDKGKNISSLTLAELRKYSDKFGLDVKRILNAWVSVSLKTSYAGTAPKLVEKQIRKWEKKLGL